LRESGVGSSEEVRESETALICFSAAMRAEKDALADFLTHRLYRHPQVMAMSERAEAILRELWQAYMSDPGRVPAHALEGAAGEPRERAIADYLAGMTDPFATDAHRALTDPTPRA
jgi:dGTPase